MTRALRQDQPPHTPGDTGLSSRPRGMRDTRRPAAIGAPASTSDWLPSTYYTPRGTIRPPPPGVRPVSLSKSQQVTLSRNPY